MIKVAGGQSFCPQDTAVRFFQDNVLDSTICFKFQSEIVLFFLYDSTINSYKFGVIYC